MRLLLVFAVLVSSFGTAHALGRLETKLAEVGPAAVAARSAETRNAKAVTKAIRKLAARPDVRAVLAGGGELILGFKDGPKKRVRAEVFETVSAALVLRAPKAGKTAPRLTARKVVVQAGEDGIGFGPRRPVKDGSMENKGNFAYAKGATARERDNLAEAIKLFDLTPAALENASIFQP